MKRWHYDSVRDLDQTLVERLRRFPREPDMLVYGVRSFVALIIRVWLRAYHRFEIVGPEICATNRSDRDGGESFQSFRTRSAFLPLPLRKLHRAFPAAAADYFFQSVPRTWMQPS